MHKKRVNQYSFLYLFFYYINIKNVINNKLKFIWKDVINYSLNLEIRLY